MQLAESYAQVDRTLRDEERINSVTHGLGLLASIVGVAVLWSRVADRGDRWQLAAACVYGGSLVAVYAASTLSHVFQQPYYRRLLRIADQALIFLLIAGTYTPIALTWLRYGMWWILFGLIWGVALAGFASKAIFVHRIEAVSTVLHVVLGWLPVIGVEPMIGIVPAPLLWWMLAGGLCYTLGTVFLHRDERHPYFHAVWHVLVMAGSACHYWGIYHYCTTAPGTAG